jgi:hypothetical protein
VAPREHDPQRARDGEVLIVDDDVPPKLRLYRVQQLLAIDRLGPRFGGLLPERLFLLGEQQLQLGTQPNDVLAEAARQLLQPDLMLALRQLDDGGEPDLPLAILLFGLLLGPLFEALLLALRLAGDRGPLLLSTVHDPALLDLLGALLLLRFLDDGLDHPLERGLVDTVLLGGAIKVKHPFDCRQAG